MDTATFLQRVVPQGGTYYLGTINNQQFKSHVFDKMSDITKFVDRCVASGSDVYFATSAYNDNSGRTATNVKLTKSLYLDLDCGETKEFANKREAILALVKFIKAVKMPQPTMLVDSGNGVHCYWELSESLEPKAWLPLAKRLKELCAEHKFGADVAVTADVARIMRIPGTFNHKGEVAKACKIIKDYGGEVDVADLTKLFALPPRLEVVPTGLGGISNNDLGGGMEVSYRPQRIEHVLPQCKTLKFIYDEGGKSCSEPLWKQTLSLLAFAEDGEDYIHEFSKHHPMYTESLTQSKFEACVRAKERNTVSGPTLCTTFELHMPDKCKGCKHKGQIKSPLVLGGEPPNALPWPFQQGPSGIFMEQLDSEGKPVLEVVVPYMITEFKLKKRTTDEGMDIMFSSSIGGSSPISGMIAQELLNDGRGASAAFSRSGLALQPKESSTLAGIMTSWVQKMQAARQVSKGGSSYGWKTRDGERGFSSGGKTHWPNGIVEAVPKASNPLYASYLAKGELAPWQAASDFIINQGRDELVAILASGYAAPLMKLTGINGMMLSVVSAKSGTGKSSALRTAQSVWGDPVVGVNALNDTANAVAKRLGVLNNLPAFWDELRHKDALEGFVKVVFQLSQGRDKARLNSSATMQEIGTWNTLITAASNESLYEHIVDQSASSDAGIMRVFEITFPDTNYLSDPAAEGLLFRSLDDNYGHAGEIYARFLVDNYDKVQSSVTKLVSSINKRVHASASERFWVNTVAVLVVGASSANACGLTKFNIPRLHKYLIEALLKMRNMGKVDIVSATTGTKDLIGMYLNEFGDQVYSVGDLLPTSRALNVGLSVAREPKRHPVIAMVAGNGAVRLNWQDFKKWAKKTGKWDSGYEKAMLAAGGQMGRRSITTGLANDYNQAACRTLELSKEAMQRLHR